MLLPVEMANWLHLSEQELANLTKGGVVRRSTEMRNGRRLIVYDARETVSAYVMHLKAPSIEARNQFVLEKGLTQQIIRAQKELELAKQRGDLLERKRVVFVVTNLLSALKQHVLALPSRCSRLLLGVTSVPQIHAILLKYCELTLRESNEFDMQQIMPLTHSTNGQHSSTSDKRKKKARAPR